MKTGYQEKTERLAAADGLKPKSPKSTLLLSAILYLVKTLGVASCCCQEELV